MSTSNKAIIAAMTTEDLLGTPVPFGKAPKAAKTPRAPRVVLTPEEQKAKRNEAQRLLRSTPEGKAYANAASKKSIALKKARIQAELDALKALVALLPVATVPPADDAAETVVKAEETVKTAEETVVVAKKKRTSTKAPKNVEDALV